MHAARHPGEELGAGMKVAEHAIMPGDSDLLLPDEDVVVRSIMQRVSGGFAYRFVKRSFELTACFVAHSHFPDVLFLSAFVFGGQTSALRRVLRACDVVSYEPACVVIQDGLLGRILRCVFAEKAVA